MAPQRILVFSLPGIGDTILASPLFAALKDHYPEAHITAITMFNGAQALLKENPHVDEVLYHDFIQGSTLSSLKMAWHLRKQRFDISILTYPANRLEYNVLQWLAGAKIRVGHRYKYWDLRSANFLSTHQVIEDDALTNTEENLRLIEAIKDETIDSAMYPVQLSIHEEYQQNASKWLKENGLQYKTLIGIHAGGSTAKNHLHKRWPKEHYRALINDLLDNENVAILVFGGKEEQDLKGYLHETTPERIHSIDNNNLWETAVLIQQCSHFIANDTALLHVAGVMSIPSTAIFGPTFPQWVRINNSQRTEVHLNLSCQPCFHYSPSHLCCIHGDYRCLTQLQPEKIVESMSPSRETSLK